MTKGNKYIASFVQGLLNSLEYRTDFFLRLLGLFVPLFIQYYLWSAIYRGTTEETLYGYSYAEMISYLIIAALTSEIISTGFENSIVDDIKNGGLNKFLVQPVNYLFYRMVHFLGGKIYQIFVFACVFLIFISVIAAKFHYTFQNLWVFVIVLLFALVLNYLVVLCISLFAFWMTETWGLFALVSVSLSILGGAVIPLDIFSPAIQNILLSLPFQYTIYFPVNVLLDKMQPELIMAGFFIQLGWIAVFAVAVSFIWRFGLRKHIAVGG